jgi:chaperonin cofactor prefoldin
LTNLIDDARKRIAAIEKQSSDAKEKGEEAQAQINAMSNPDSLPGVDLNAAPVA